MKTISSARCRFLSSQVPPTILSHYLPAYRFVDTYFVILATDEEARSSHRGSHAELSMSTGPLTYGIATTTPIIQSKSLLSHWSSNFESAWPEESGRKAVAPVA